MPQSRNLIRILFLGSVLSLPVACGTSEFDWDLRQGAGLNTSEAARMISADRPRPDNRGVISYPGYQVVVAQRGDTVESVASRIGVSASELASYNAILPGVTLRDGEVLALPNRVAEPSPATGAIATGPIRPAGQIDIDTLASNAIDRAGSGSAAPAPTPPASAQAGQEPVRHKVVRGETAFSISRLYNVTTRALADWNGLGPDLVVREGQFLLIPVPDAAANQARVAAAEPVPGQGSPTPEPPSAAQPLPDEQPVSVNEPVAAPASPDLGQERTAASSSRLSMPAAGSVIRGYVKKKNDGIDIGAAAGSAVKAADDGTVAAITQDTEQVPIVVVRHADGLLTVYANITGITVKKGDKVSRGQTIAKVRDGNPSFVHFEVRKGFDSVDPLPYLN
ncbi:MAG: M23 family metallopeptidase [Paracoccaceae bacterium]